MAAAPTPIDIMTYLQQKYQPLVGMIFQATYEGEITMPQTGNQRDVLVIGQGTSFAAALSEIANAVLQTFGERVWKGITRRENRYRNTTEYLLWVEPLNISSNMSGVIAEQPAPTFNFRVDQCTPFLGNGNPFSHGVSIQVSTCHPAC